MPTWKVVTVGAALTGLGVVGAGAASAASEPVPAAHAAIGSSALDWVFADDRSVVSFAAMDDSWDDSWDDSPWDDSPYDD
ncbi:hypothetical protein CRI77_14490 [Mycolicibacterium duvalii]|nr:hypothetical protein CRI77_14490 [Mycolicibacterium duvalii]